MKHATRQDDEDACRIPPTRLDLHAIRAARERLHGAIVETPVAHAHAASRATGAHVWIKHDHLQLTGSFKERGAAHALSLLTGTTRTRGVIAASAGNHALGLARHGARLGVPVTLVMPRNAAQVKIERCRLLGAEVVLHGTSFGEADVHARAAAIERGLRYVHPFDDLAVMAGQGTLGLELLEQVPDLDVIGRGGSSLLRSMAVAVSPVPRCVWRRSARGAPSLSAAATER
jgi:threonine dehydratase